jgi:uncharacterized HAD superfamily protein
MSKIICIDIDNTICRTKLSQYRKSKPNKKIISYINKLYDSGYIIKIYTARYMGRFKDNKILAKKYGYAKTVKQLKKWKVNFHVLHMGKPSADIYIDDKNLYFKKNWTQDLDRLLKKLN